MATTGLTKAEQADKTRRALLDAARTLFTTQGYVAASTEEIVRRAGLTRGALYYYFPNKAALFEAVFDEVGQEYIAALQADLLAAQGDAWQRLMRGVERFWTGCWTRACGALCTWTARPCWGGRPASSAGSRPLPCYGISLGR